MLILLNLNFQNIHLTYSKESCILLTMTTKSIAITSKNQITIPAEIVRELKLDKSRRLTIRKRGDELILKAQPNLEEKLSDIWKQLPEFNGTKTDAELKVTTTEAWKNTSL